MRTMARSAVGFERTTSSLASCERGMRARSFLVWMPSWSEGRPTHSSREDADSSSSSSGTAPFVRYRRYSCPLPLALNFEMLIKGRAERMLEKPGQTGWLVNLAHVVGDSLLMSWLLLGASVVMRKLLCIVLRLFRAARVKFPFLFPAPSVYSMYMRKVGWPPIQAWAGCKDWRRLYAHSRDNHSFTYRGSP